MKIENGVLNATVAEFDYSPPTIGKACDVMIVNQNGDVLEYLPRRNLGGCKTRKRDGVMVGQLYYKGPNRGVEVATVKDADGNGLQIGILRFDSLVEKTPAPAIVKTPMVKPAFKAPFPIRRESIDADAQKYWDAGFYFQPGREHEWHVQAGWGPVGIPRYDPRFLAGMALRHFLWIQARRGADRALYWFDYLSARVDITGPEDVPEDDGDDWEP